MSPVFRDARLKVDRANKHISDLQADIRSLRGTYTASIQKYNDTGHQDLIHDIPNLEGSLLSLSLIVGDAVHNLHTALDFAWVGAIERNAPTANSKFTKFPVQETREKLDASLRGARIDVACPRLFEKIMSEIQPYESGQSGVIYVLHDLDIDDKHLLLLELTPNAGIKGIVIRDKEGQVLRGIGMTVQHPGPYVIPFESDIKIEDKGKLSFDITIRKAGVFAGIPVLDLFSHFSQYVLYVVQSLENL